jgi:hypothetical protein
MHRRRIGMRKGHTDLQADQLFSTLLAINHQRYIHSVCHDSSFCGLMIENAASHLIEQGFQNVVESHRSISHRRNVARHASHGHSRMESNSEHGMPRIEHHKIWSGYHANDIRIEELFFSFEKMMVTQPPEANSFDDNPISREFKSIL